MSDYPNTKICIEEERGSITAWLQFRWDHEPGLYGWAARVWNWKQAFVWENRYQKNYFHLRLKLQENGGLYDYVGHTRTTHSRAELFLEDDPEAIISLWGIWLKVWPDHRADVGVEFQFRDRIEYSGSFEIPWNPYVFLNSWRVYEGKDIKLDDRLTSTVRQFTYTPSKAGATFQNEKNPARNFSILQ